MTADVKLLPLPEATMKSYQTDGAMRTMTLYSYSASDMRDFARANVSHTTAAKNAELVELRSAIEALRAEVDCANAWNERVSVCRDHVADIVDGPCVICALNAAKASAQQPTAVDGVKCPWDEGSPCVDPRPAGMVYPTKPAPRASGYLDSSGVEWNAWDAEQMEAYARAAYSDGWEAGYRAALAAQHQEPKS